MDEYLAKQWPTPPNHFSEHYWYCAERIRHPGRMRSAWYSFKVVVVRDRRDNAKFEGIADVHMHRIGR